MSYASSTGEGQRRFLPLPSRRQGGPTIPPDLSLTLVQSLFDRLPDVSFCVKDKSLRYVCGNTAMLDLCGARSNSEFLGKTARDFFPEVTRRQYETWDRQVVRTQRPITDRLWFSLRLRGRPVWLLYGSWPIAGLDKEPFGVAAVARVLEAPGRRHPIYERLATALDYMQRNFGASFDIADLARRTGVTISQLERDFMILFGVAPRRYLTKVRLDAAIQMLETDEAIVDIAHACGYTDQSAFTRRFRAVIGISPTEYRRLHAQHRTASEDDSR